MKNRASEVAALLSNWEQVESAMQAATNAEGTAAEENEKYMDSVKGHLDTLEATWQEFSADFLSSDFLKGAITGVTGLVSILDKLTKTFGVLGTIGIGNGIFQLFKNGSAIKTFASDIGLTTLRFKDLGSAASLAGTSMKSFMKTPAGIATSIGLVVAAIGVAIQAVNNYNQKKQAERQALIETAQTSNEEANNILSLYATYQQANAAYESNTGSKEALTSATSALLSALGYEDSKIQELVGKYGTLDNAINNITMDSLTKAADDAVQGFNAAHDSLQASFGNGDNIWANIKKYFNADSESVSWMEDTNELGQKVGKILEDAKLLSSGSYNTGGQFFLDTDTPEEIEASYDKLLKMQQTLMDAKKNGTLTNDEYNDSGLVDAIDNEIARFEETYQSYIDARNLMNESLAKSNVFDSLQNNGVPKTSEEFYKLRESLISAAEAGDEFKGTGTEIENAFDTAFSDLSTTFPDLSKVMGENISGIFDSSITDVKEKAKILKDNFYSGMSGGVPSDVMDSIKNPFDDWIDGLSDEDKEIVYKIGVESDDTTLWSLTQWQNEFNYVKSGAKEADESLQQFYSTMNNTEDGNFSDNINSQLDSISELQDALSQLDKGSFSEKDKLSLAMDYPELAPYLNDTNAFKQAIQDLIDTSNQGLDDSFAQQLEALGGEGTVAGQALLALKAAMDGLNNTDGFNFDIDDEVEKFDNLYAAMKESVSGTGLSSSGLENVKAMFSDLDGYDPSKLFERTANGIHMNTSELRQLQSEYEKQNKAEIDNHLTSLIDDYNSLSKELSTCTDAQERASKVSQLNSLQEQITSTADLAAQYEGLTSAYNKWIEAQSAGEEGDMYDNVTSSLTDIKDLYDQGLVGTNAFRTAVQLMSNEDLSTANIDQLVAAYENGYPKMQRYFTDSQDGCQNFLNDVQDLNSEWVHMNEDGSWDINFGNGNDQDVADALGINVEAVQMALRKLSDYGFDINLDSTYSSLDELGNYAEQANDKLKELGKTDIDFNFNSSSIEDVESQITQAQTLLDTFKNTDGTINTSLEGATEAEAVLIGLISRKQELSQPAVMSVDTSNADSNISSTIGLLQDFQSNYNDIEIETAVGVDTSDAQTNIQSVLGEINSMPDEVKTSLGLDDSAFQSALSTITSTNVDVKAGVNLDASALATIQSTIAGISPEVMVKAGLDSSLIDEYTPSDKDSTVKYNVDDSKVQSYTAPAKTGTVTYSATMNSWSAPTKYGTIVYTAKAGARGTAFNKGTVSKGTTGKAFKQGDWGTKENGTALGGELGQELIVRDGRFFTIGNNSAEFFSYKKGDIIFSAAQTKEIFEKGKITSGNKRGNALYTGTAFSSGSGHFNPSGSGSSSSGSSSSSSSSSSGSSSSSSGNSSSSSSEKETKETFDWLEIAIDRIERAIERLDKKASSIYKTWSFRNSNLSSEISSITSEINLQQQAYNRYIQQANSVGLSEGWATKIRNGEINLDTITDEDLIDKIKEYKEWYEKALDCKDAIEDLKETESDLYKTAFDNVVSEYEAILDVIDFNKSMLDEKVNQQESKGHIVSTEYYKALQAQEQANINKLQQEKDSLTTSLSNAVNSGTIQEYSEAWYDMCSEIDNVTLSIEEANTAMINYDNSIREINWQVFDLIQDRIEQITKESDFLIKLMEDGNLYDDKGQLTNTGQATMGLHAVNYDTYMAQADKYADEIKNIEKEIAKDPYNQDLIERRQELLELQQESILAANDEKEAIKDMVSEGIEKELDALNDLIDKYTDALDSQKDLYDYQKKVKEQTEEIATLEKQLSAYEGDTSEETKAKIQEIKISLQNAKDDLQETEYDQYISDAKKILDDMYNEYELILNQRLDNIDQLLSDMILDTNKNASLIQTTLETETRNVGISLSDNMKAIWDTSGGANTVVSTYADSIKGAITTVGTTINNISVNIKSMMDALNINAKSESSNATNSSSTNSTPSTTTSSPSTPKTGTGNGKAEIGDQVTFNSGKYYSDSEGSNPWGHHNLGGKVYITKIHAGNPYPYHISTGKTLGDGDLGWLKLDQLSGYATGKKDLPKDEMAWTQEKGREFIVRPSDGAILTPVAKKDSVLNTSASSNIWDMANNPSEFIRDSLNIGTTSPITQTVAGNNYNSDISLEITLPNVQNYEQFKYAMQHDKNFESMVRAMTVDKMFGGSSLKKYKY